MKSGLGDIPPGPMCMRGTLNAPVGWPGLELRHRAHVEVRVAFLVDELAGFVRRDALDGHRSLRASSSLTRCRRSRRRRSCAAGAPTASAKTSGAGSRLTTRNASRGKSKKYPGWTSDAARAPAGAAPSPPRSAWTAPARPPTSRLRRRAPTPRTRRGRGAARRGSPRSARGSAAGALSARARIAGAARWTGVADGQEGIGDELQPGQRLVARRRGAGGGDPSQLQLGQGARLRQAAQAEGERRARVRPGWRDGTDRRAEGNRQRPRRRSRRGRARRRGRRAPRHSSFFM